MNPNVTLKLATQLTQTRSLTTGTPLPSQLPPPPPPPGHSHRQIDQVQFADPHVVLPVQTALTPLYGGGEDGVGPRTVLVHVGRPHRSCRGGTAEWVRRRSAGGDIVVTARDRVKYM